MARLIHCPECNKRFAESAQRYRELYEFIEGTTKKDMFCDGAHGELLVIPQGDTCFACVLLPNRDHFNYNNQRPEVWADEYINRKT